MTDRYALTPDFRIVSGGQTGADMAGLDWAIANGVTHGGWCPKGRKSESGPIDLVYCLSETPSANYLQRTEWNVRDSDATLIFTMDDQLEGGSKRTREFADRHKKPWMHFRPGVHPKFIGTFLHQHHVRLLNIAGKRASGAADVHGFVTQALDAALCAPDSAGPGVGLRAACSAAQPRPRIQRPRHRQRSPHCTP